MRQFSKRIVSQIKNFHRFFKMSNPQIKFNVTIKIKSLNH